MSNTLITILVILATLVPMILGAIHGNNEVQNKFQSNFKGVFLFFVILKRSVIHFFLFALIVGILSMFLSEPWLYGAFCLYVVINYFFMKNKIIEEYDILLKPGEGLLTPEGSKRLNNTSNENQTISNSSNNDSSSTLIYSSWYGGSIIGKLNSDGSVYDTRSGSYIGRVDECKVYRHSSGGSILARYDSEGRVYEGLISYERLGKITSGGIIHEPDITDNGKPIARVEGPDIYGAGAAYLALLN